MTVTVDRSQLKLLKKLLKLSKKYDNCKVDHLAGITGMHEFSEFSSMDVGTINSGLNSIVLANDRETVSHESVKGRSVVRSAVSDTCAI